MSGCASVAREQNMRVQVREGSSMVYRCTNSWQVFTGVGGQFGRLALPIPVGGHITGTGGGDGVARELWWWGMTCFCAGR